MLTARIGNTARYAILMAMQTIVATFVFLTIFPLFRQMIDHIGTRQTIEPRVQVKLIGGAVVLQILYWARLRWIAVPVPFRSALLGHLILFASRVSFFFGGAFFSAIFFRHVPELDRLPPIAQAIIKVAVVLAILFSMFCYSLELERFGRAVGRDST